MKVKNANIDASTGSVTDGGSLSIHPRKQVSLVAKLILSAFMAVMVPVYLHTYGPTNFIWFCDTALVLTTVGIWLESPLLISMCAVGILLPQGVWLVDFGSHLFGIRLLGLTGYMFDHQLSLFTRGLSLFHGWLPMLLVWLLLRFGYDQRALWAWTGVAAGVGLVCYGFTPPPGVYLGSPNLPVNINYLYGFDDRVPQHWMNQNLYAGLWLAVLWLGAFLPTHLLLRKIFSAPAKPAPKVSIRFV